ncbi:sensor domain-containing phosphodiesterase [Sagittula sp. S175]|uniref:sensor domain-containing phosphodiesterase n=1 Tax=Sagittula sp. S175 TaxID=3415129 RepID=UPI003C7DCF43
MISHDFREAFAINVVDKPENLRWKKRKVLRALREVYDMEVAFISRFRDNERVFDEVDISPDAPPLPLERGAASPLASSYCYRISEQTVPNVIIDARTLPGVADIPETFSWPIGAHISVPIVLSTGATYGMLCAFSRRVDPNLSRRDLAMFTLCADLLARDIDARTPLVTSDANLLQDAITKGRFDFYLQPVVQLPDRQLIGYELLTRFPPDVGRTEEIFQRARYLDLVTSIEEVIARKASIVLDRLPPEVILSINFSVASVEDLDFAAIFPEAERHRIVIELTEHEQVSNYETFLQAIDGLRRLGFRVAIDDVGAGYSSFRHVIQLKPEVIKIDRSLIAGIDHSAERGSLANALREYSEIHGACLIAEGVETADELARVQALGIPYAQGYAIARPAPFEALLGPSPQDSWKNA